MQIIISVGKLILFQGRQIEGLVGSVSHIGGAQGTTIPVLGFVFLWLYRKGQFAVKDWIYLLGLMLLGFLAGKRAVWFIMPMVIAAFMIYVNKIKVGKTFWITIILAPFAFFAGAKLTPSLNPEHKIWGSFDFAYIFDYAETYSFGPDESVNKIPIANKNKEAEGRGGATLALTHRFFDAKKLSGNDWLGVGFSTMYATDYGEFAKSDLTIDLNHKGSATGVFQSYVTTGYLGVFATLLFFFYMLLQIKARRLRWALMVVVAWEYFFYTGMIFRTTAFMALIIYFIHYSNWIVSQNKQLKYEEKGIV
ncbi:MAG: hypothetical protein PHH37_08755 [Paludibacter sp.]|nr:hypothetical protein [Paludibacter sp.]